MPVTFEDKYKVNTESGCWEWCRAISSTGYGVVWFQGKLHPAHRAVYLLLKGAIEDGFDLDHLCRNKACVNPDHLQPVTRATNARRGNGTKLTETQVNTIHSLNKDGVGYRKLAKMFNVHRSTICHLITRRNWKNA